MTLLREWWRWFKRQSRLNKVVIVSFLVALVMFLVPSVVSWLKPTPIHVGAAFYTYERAFLLEANTKTYFYENRNLVSDCSLRRVEQALPKGRAKTPDPQSWVVSKFLLENMTDHTIYDIERGGHGSMGSDGARCPSLVCGLYYVTPSDGLSGSQLEDSHR